MKKLVVFDLDGTLAESKAPIDAEMAALLSSLLRCAKVAVISGGNWPQFQDASALPPPARRTSEESVAPPDLRNQVLPIHGRIGRSSIRKISPRWKKRQSSARSIIRSRQSA